MILNEKRMDVFANDIYIFIKDIIEDNLKVENSYAVIGNIELSGNLNSNHDLICFGNIQATKINVKGTLTCFGNITAEEIETGIDLECYKSITCKSLFIGRSGFIESGTIENIETGQNLFVKDTIEIIHNLCVKNLVCFEGVFGEGCIKADNSIISEYCEIPAENINTKLYVLNDSVSNNTKEDIDRKQISSGGDGYEPLLTILEEENRRKKDLFENLETWETRFTYEDMLLMLDNYSTFSSEFKSIYSLFRQVLVYSNFSKIEYIQDFLYLLDLKKKLPPEFNKISIVKDTFEILLGGSRINIMNLKIKVSKHSDLIKLLSIVEDNKEYFRDSEYLFLMDKIYNLIGLKFETVQKLLNKG